MFLGLINFLQGLQISPILIVGLITIIAFYFGRTMKYIKLPLIIGYMVIGVVLGPSLLNLIDNNIQESLSFITEIALGFVALSIGLELKFSSIKRLGVGIIYIILLESFCAFLLVFLAIYLLTKNLPLALIFAAIAPASAPAGTVAVIQEYKAKGSLTKALYAVVGFDDGLGIIIFGFAAAIARAILGYQINNNSVNIFIQILIPLREIITSLAIGGILGLLFALFAKKLKNPNDILIMIFGFVLTTVGLCNILHLSSILTNMIIGIFIVNTQPQIFNRKIHERLTMVMPLLFILFFTIAGANLNIKALPSLGLLGGIYVVSRAAGLIGGSRLGGILGKVEDKIKKYLGLGILSQAGVAIGLALIIKHEFQGLGKIADTQNGITSGDRFGSIVITTVTAACIIFELIGPILTKIGLRKAGEIEEM